MSYETTLDESDRLTARFQPADDQLRQDVVALEKCALSVYLAEQPENRRPRSNEVTTQVENGVAHAKPAPERVD